jgi:hypothetical protein
MARNKAVPSGVVRRFEIFNRDHSLSRLGTHRQNRSQLACHGALCGAG